LGRLQIDLVKTSQATPIIYYVVVRQNWYCVVPSTSPARVISSGDRDSLNLAYRHHRIYKRSRLRRLHIDLLKTSQETPIIYYVVGARQNWYSIISKKKYARGKRVLRGTQHTPPTQPGT
jgi:hypothetical protein